MDRSLSLVLNGERPFCRPSLESLHVFFERKLPSVTSSR